MYCVFSCLVFCIVLWPLCARICIVLLKVCSCDLYCIVYCDCRCSHSNQTLSLRLTYDHRGGCAYVLVTYHRKIVMLEDQLEYIEPLLWSAWIYRAYIVISLNMIWRLPMGLKWDRVPKTMKRCGATYCWCKFHGGTMAKHTWKREFDN